MSVKVITIISSWLFRCRLYYIYIIFGNLPELKLDLKTQITSSKIYLNMKTHRHLIYKTKTKLLNQLI